MVYKGLVCIFMLLGCHSTSSETLSKPEASKMMEHKPNQPKETTTQQRTSTDSTLGSAKSKTFPIDGVLVSKMLNQEECEQQFPLCSSLDQNNFFPQFQNTTLDISEERQQLMTGKTWREGCPVGFDDLVILRFLHWNETGGVQWGEIVIAKEEAQNMAEIFRDLYHKTFPLTSAKPMYHFDGNDDLSMAANNTSAFNCRNVKNSNRFSEHSYGKAIDVNPLWNPWVSKKGRVDPPSGKEFVDRNLDKKGLLKAGDDVVGLFQKYGWKWGGYWKSSKDYQHFSISGR